MKRNNFMDRIRKDTKDQLVNRIEDLNNFINTTTKENPLRDRRIRMRDFAENLLEEAR